MIASGGPASSRGISRVGLWIAATPSTTACASSEATMAQVVRRRFAGLHLALASLESSALEGSAPAAHFVAKPARGLKGPRGPRKR